MAASRARVRTSLASRSTSGYRVVRSHNPRWLPRRDGRLLLRQELHKLGADATSLLVRTICERTTSAVAGACFARPAYQRLSDSKAVFAGSMEARKTASSWTSRGGQVVTSSRTRSRRQCGSGSGASPAGRRSTAPASGRRRAVPSSSQARGPGGHSTRQCSAPPCLTIRRWLSCGPHLPGTRVERPQSVLLRAARRRAGRLPLGGERTPGFDGAGEP